jgi:hypothetical protein
MHGNLIKDRDWRDVQHAWEMIDALKIFFDSLKGQDHSCGMWESNITMDLQEKVCASMGWMIQTRGRLS